MDSSGDAVAAVGEGRAGDAAAEPVAAGSVL